MSNLEQTIVPYVAKYLGNTGDVDILQNNVDKVLEIIKALETDGHLHIQENIELRYLRERMLLQVINHSTFDTLFDKADKLVQYVLAGK